jgi:hypothetical protein
MFSKERGFFFLKNAHLTDKHAPNFACKMNSYYRLLLSVVFIPTYLEGAVAFVFYRNII